jgi:tetratricopeptide (TPR) repeat protein
MRGRTRAAALIMSALLLLYLVFAIWYAVVLLRVGDPVATGMGVALLVLPLIGLWALGAELLFAVRAERLARRLETEGGMPDEQLPVAPSGRVDREAADAAFPTYRAAVEAAPEDWRAWFRLALAYDAAGDRRRARWATRQAIRFARAAG